MVEILATEIRKLTAPNPSPMTAQGTNTYIVGTDDVVIIDPGPIIESHMLDIVQAVPSAARVSAILITHSHVDHSPLAAPLSETLKVPIYAYGDSFSGRSPLMQTLAAQRNIGGGEGMDAAFRPDVCLHDGQILNFGTTRLTAHWTPGHFGNHMCFGFGDTLFCGDHVMGWASSLVSPPDGDLGAFMRSCEKLLSLPYTRYLAGHGAPIEDGPARVKWLIEHRKSREAQITAQLKHDPQSAQEIAHAIYTETPAPLMPAAARNVLAHLIDLYERNLVKPLGNIEKTTKFQIN